MERRKLWSRVGGWLKRSERSPSDRSPPSIGDFSSGEPVAGVSGSAVPGPAPVDEGVSAASRARLARSSGRVEQLEEQYARVVSLVESVQTHLEAQAGRSERMAGALDRLARCLEHLPDASKTQLGLLEKVGEEVAGGAAFAKRLEGTMSQLPQLADAQREAMVSIGRQLASSRESSENVAATLDGFQKAVAGLSEATSASTATLKEMRGDISAREERVASLLEEQMKRLTRFAWVVVVLGAAGVVTGLIALLL